MSVCRRCLFLCDMPFPYMFSFCSEPFLLHGFGSHLVAWSDAPQAPPPAWAAGDSLERSKLRFNWNPCHTDCSVEQSVRKRMRTLRSTVLGSRQVLESVANVAVVLWLLRCQLRSHRRTHTRGSQKAQWPVFCRCPNHVSCAQKYDDGSFFLCHGT